MFNKHWNYERSPPKKRLHFKVTAADLRLFALMIYHKVAAGPSHLSPHIPPCWNPELGLLPTYPSCSTLTFWSSLNFMLWKESRPCVPGLCSSNPNARPFVTSKIRSNSFYYNIWVVCLFSFVSNFSWQILNSVLFQFADEMYNIYSGNAVVEVVTVKTFDTPFVRKSRSILQSSEVIQTFAFLLVVG